MRSSIAIAAFAIGALASPHVGGPPPAYEDTPDVAKSPEVPNNNGPHVEHKYDLVYVTEVVTVTVDANAAKATPEHYGHHKKPQPAPPKYEAPAPPQEKPQAPPKYEAPAPPQEKPQAPPKYEAPAPPPYQPQAPPKYEAPAPPKYGAPSKPSPQGYSAPEAPASTDYTDLCLFHHNIHRANHSVPSLTWSKELEGTAREVALSCNYAHNTAPGGGGYGQNIAAGVSRDNISAVITDLFYNGEEPLFAGNYGATSPDMSNFEGWGHFTQIVWKDTTQVGCYTTTRDDCPQGVSGTGGNVEPYFTVCNYKTPGNYANQYGANVLKPLGQASAGWDAGLAAYHKAKKH